MYTPKIFFTSDYHWNHSNIIKYCHRPFHNVHEMNETIINNYNSRVKDCDICYNLGDLYLRSGKEGGKSHYWEFLKRLNGRHVIIRGNHDYKNKPIDILRSAKAYTSGLSILLVHDPINSKVEYDLNIVGHVHSAWKTMELQEKRKTSLIINVGVDVWDFKPVSWKEIYAIYCRWKKGIIKPEIFDKKELKRIRSERKRK